MLKIENVTKKYKNGALANDNISLTEPIIHITFLSNGIPYFFLNSYFVMLQHSNGTNGSITVEFILNSLS